MKVSKPLFVFVLLCAVGIIIGFGKSADAPTLQGHTIWMWVGIVCSVITAIGALWLWNSSRGK